MKGLAGQRQWVKAVVVIMTVGVVLCASLPLAPAQTAPQKAGQPAGPVVTLRLGHIVKEGSLYDRDAVKFQERVQQTSGGRIHVQVARNGSLGFERDLIEGMKAGTVDAGIITSSALSNYLPKIMVLDLPFIFTSTDQAHHVLDGNVGKALFAALEQQNLKGLAWVEGGWRYIISKKSVRAPDDLAGVKFRVMENPLMLATFKALGANATPMAWGEVYTSLQQGAITALDLPLWSTYSEKVYEVANHLTTSRHMFTPVILLMSFQKFKSFSPELQKAIMDAAADTMTYGRAEAAKEENNNLNLLRQKGMQIIDVADVKVWQGKMSTVYGQFQDKIGSDVISSVRNTK